MSVSTKLSRIDLRIDLKNKELLELAAESNHLSLSSYILSVCLKQAEYDLAKNETLRLNDKERELIMLLLENDEPNDALKDLFK